MLHPDQRVIPIDRVPKGVNAIKVSNTGNILKDGFYYDTETKEYLEYITENGE